MPIKIFLIGHTPASLKKGHSYILNKYVENARIHPKFHNLFEDTHIHLVFNLVVCN